MEVIVKTLLIARTKVDLTTINGSLVGSVTLLSTEMDLCTTLLSAALRLSEECYDLCLVSDEFSLNEMQAFLSDYDKLADKNRCPCVKLILTNSKEIPANSFRASIALEPTQVQCDSLCDIFKESIKKLKRERIVSDLAPSIKLALKELDRVAFALSRGIRQGSNKIAARYLKESTSDDPKLLDLYFDSLQDKADTMQTGGGGILNLPKRLAGRADLRLSNNRYIGTSVRVWKRLSSRFGSKSE